MEGKVALVTGASGGTGLANARRFADVGASVVLAARTCGKHAQQREATSAPMKFFFLAELPTGFAYPGGRNLVSEAGEGVLPAQRSVLFFGAQARRRV
jgi:NAD(P)-dependent dehydrogenase (short-subunit alcohol dehydrogenase family)